MATVKLIIGIISMVLPAIILFQSCAAGLVEAFDGGNGGSGGAGVFLAICMLIAGIVGVATRKGGKGGGITAGAFYAIGGLIGIANLGVFVDLVVWSVLCFIFAGIFILGSIFAKKPSA